MPTKLKRTVQKINKVERRKFWTCKNIPINYLKNNYYHNINIINIYY
jgi:hypothetical protein